MVRLVVKDANYVNTAEESFNSTMVRLVVRMRPDTKLFNKFQFHYGTIGSLLCPSIRHKLLVSIPLWYDW